MMGRRLLVTLARVTMKLDRFQTDPAPSRNREDDQAGGRFQERHVMRPPIDGCPTKVAPQRGIAVLFGLTSRTEARPKAPSQLARPERLRFASLAAADFPPEASGSLTVRLLRENRFSDEDRGLRRRSPGSPRHL